MNPKNGIRVGATEPMNSSALCAFRTTPQKGGVNQSSRALPLNLTDSPHFQIQRSVKSPVSTRFLRSFRHGNAIGILSGCHGQFEPEPGAFTGLAFDVNLNSVGMEYLLYDA